MNIVYKINKKTIIYASTHKLPLYLVDNFHIIYYFQIRKHKTINKKLSCYDLYYSISILTITLNFNENIWKKVEN